MECCIVAHLTHVHQWRFLRIHGISLITLSHEPFLHTQSAFPSDFGSLASLTGCGFSLVGKNLRFPMHENSFSPSRNTQHPSTSFSHEAIFFSIFSSSSSGFFFLLGSREKKKNFRCAPNREKSFRFFRVKTENTCSRSKNNMKSGKSILKCASMMQLTSQYKAVAIDVKLRLLAWAPEWVLKFPRLKWFLCNNFMLLRTFLCCSAKSSRAHWGKFRREKALRRCRDARGLLSWRASAVKTPSILLIKSTLSASNTIFHLPPTPSQCCICVYFFFTSCVVFGICSYSTWH